MLEPKDFPLTRADGKTVDFVLSKFPAVQGREIIAKYPVANTPKIGDYQVSQEVMLKLMSFVSVRVGEENKVLVPLTNIDLVNNHTGDWETLAKLEWAMMEYNCSFFANGFNSDFLTELSHKAGQWVSQMLTTFLQQLSQMERQPSMSSKPSTRSKRRATSTKS